MERRGPCNCFRVAHEQFTRRGTPKVRCACFVTIGRRGADSNTRRTSSRPFIEQTTRQLELTITPPHASSSDGATHPGAAWNRRLRSLLASAPQAFDSASLFPGNREHGLGGTTQQHNTHIRDIREVCYSWHPWHGRPVWVHATLVKRGQAVAHCSLEEIQPSRVLEVPLWMLDAAVCCKARASKPGFASAQSLRELKEVLQAAQPRDQSTTASKPHVWSKYARHPAGVVVYDERSAMRDRFHWARLLAFVTGLVNQELLLRK